MVATSVCLSFTEKRTRRRDEAGSLGALVSPPRRAYPLRSTV